MAETTERLDKGLRTEVDEIHRHLEEQDKKLDEIIKRMEKLQSS